MDEQQTPTAGTPIYQESQEKNAKWLWILIILIIIGALVFAFLRGIGPFSRFKATSQEQEESPSPFVFTNSPAPSPQEATKSAGLDRSEPKIRVLNGSGKAGIASVVKDFLEGKSYKVTAIGNADNFDFEKTTLRFKATFAKFANLLEGDLSSNYSVAVDEEELEATDSADIEVIVGAK